MAASNSILKLQVDDKQYEASLKSAQSGMQALMDALRQSGKAFNDVDKQTEQYVRELGKMETKATTTRGRIGEMSSAFIELSQVEKQLTNQERQSPVGKALTESLEQLKRRTIDAKNELEDLNNELNGAGKASGGGLFGGGKLDGMLQVFGGNLMTKAAGAVASLGSEMVGLVQQGVEMAKAGEGIRIAFERLGRGDILDGLREATHGTVTDLELMKAAVKFNDFKLPLDELGTMLAFAQQKAKDTGQSVDYMVDSIVTGLGRKSLMILDNLGLSATEVKDKMKETGDMTKAVGAIIREQMAKAGDYVETAADRATQANVSLQNKMEELGRKFAPLEEASNSLWTSMKIGIMDVIGGPLTDLLNKLTAAGRMMNAYGKMGGSGKVGRMTANLAGASEQNRQSLYQQQQQQFWKYINPREQQIRDIRAWQSGQRGEALQGRISAITEKYGSLDATKIQAEVDAAKKMLAEYQQAAKQILQPISQEITPVINTKGGTTTGGTMKRTADDIIREQGLAMQRQLYAGAGGIGPAADTGPSEIWKALVAREDRRLSDRRGALDALEALNKAEGINPSGRDKEKSREDRNILGTSKALLNGVSQLTDGLEKIGIDIPEEVQSVIGVIQGVMQVIDAVNTIIGVTQTSALTANTVAMTSLTAALWANTSASWIPFANGGVVHAASGIVTGNTFSGDQIPAMLNAGEVVLNRAQTGNLASQLQGNGFGNARLVGKLKGRDMIIMIDRELSATGKGQMATWK